MLIERIAPADSVSLPHIIFFRCCLGARWQNSLKAPKLLAHRSGRSKVQVVIGTTNVVDRQASSGNKGAVRNVASGARFLHADAIV